LIIAAGGRKYRAYFWKDARKNNPQTLALKGRGLQPRRKDPQNEQRL
jgi:hypothetical protein